MECLTRGNRRSLRRGTMLVEAALILPIMIILTFGVIEYGWVFINAQHVSNAARHGARVGARVDSTAADVQTEVAALLAQNNITATVTVSPADLSSLEKGDVVTVTVELNYADASLINLAMIPVPEHLRSSVSMARESS